MTVLVLGKPDSGKSAIAEREAVKLSEGGKLYYIATMIPFDKEGKERIKKHREQRKGKGFTTIECPLDPGKLKDVISPDSTCLLECMSNLVGNEMHEEGREDMDIKELSLYITDRVMLLSSFCRNLVVVSNEFSLYDDGYDEDTIKYTKLMHEVNRILREKADIRYEYTEGEWKTDVNN